MWSDLIFLQYYLLYLFLAWVFVLAVSLASYLISRSAGNHIAGIAAAIPAGTVAAMYGSWAFRYMDYLEYDRLLPSSVLICFLLLAVAVCAVLARERKGDVI